jgi:hypothetical protein
MMRCSHLILALFAVPGLVACDLGSEAAFTRGRSLVPCDQNIPACAGEFALCSLNSTTYARQTFPDASPFRVLVAALPQEFIEVSFYLVTQEDVGLRTNIYWNEPGCFDSYVYKSQGEDLFKEAEDTNTFMRREAVYEGGDHMIVVDTDMRAEVIIAVDVTVPLRAP